MTLIKCEMDDCKYNRAYFCDKAEINLLTFEGGNSVRCDDFDEDCPHEEGN